MGDVWNYLIVEKHDVDNVCTCLTKALDSRGFSVVANDADLGAGARAVSVWESTQGPIVIDLMEWEEADPELAAAFSQLLASDVVLSFRGKGDFDDSAYFSRGKRTTAPSTSFGKLASESDEAYGLAPAGTERTLVVKGPATEASRLVDDAIRKAYGSLLDGLGFRRTKKVFRDLDWRAPLNGDSVTFSAKLHDGSSLVLRLYIETYGGAQHLFLLDHSGYAGSARTQVLDEREAGGWNEGGWKEKAEYVERDLTHFFRIHFVVALKKVLEERDPQRAETLATLTRAMPSSPEDPRVGEVLQAEWTPAQLVFRGERMLNVRAANGWSLSFRYDQLSTVPSSAEIAVADIVRLRTGDIRGRAVRIGSTVLRFDALGKFVSTECAPSSMSGTKN